MGNFKRDNRDNRDNRRSGSGRPTMYKATCAECGVSCEVPFRPTGDRPVFCSDCFKNQGSDGAGRRSNFGDKQRSNFRQYGSGSKNLEKIMEQISLLNTKVDKITEMLNLKISVEKIEKPKVKKAVKEKKRK